MGLFDSLLNKGAKMLKEAAVDAISDVADGVLDGIKGEDSAVVSKQSAKARRAVDVPAGYEDIANATVDVKLRKILAKEFAQYEIREQVSPTTIGGTGTFKAYDFVVYENGVAKLFIMVVYNNTCAKRDYRWSKEEAARAGVPMINFVYAFENKIDYMINRLHQYL